MPRRAQAKKREISPDAKYNNMVIAKLVNKVMRHGKKTTAENIVYGALEIVEQREHKEAVTVLEGAVRNVTPLLEVKPRRVGGATYQVPVEVRPGRNQALAIRWLLKSARARAGRSMAEKLAAELSDASKGQGAAVKRREDTHKMAEANRAFAHYRW
ncbi:MAG: 30S ribosomal protein S7 [Dehalococcoidales bacterium]|jgi:small subunit ribosomal protein S7|nr:30S ribosomal protein S7 [Dehalococcoidales bacterium]|tara:strand:+ start:693 stop:1163 length:471 start_codon:yes stop_codon:yes gene_type:complete